MSRILCTELKGPLLGPLRIRMPELTRIVRIMLARFLVEMRSGELDRSYPGYTETLCGWKRPQLKADGQVYLRWGFRGSRVAWKLLVALKFIVRNGSKWKQLSDVENFHFDLSMNIKGAIEVLLLKD